MWILVFLVISNLLFPTNSEPDCKLPNTGTVLFRNIDVYRKYCWSREELALLYSRRAIMDLIPKQIPHNIPFILEFLQICLTTLKEQATSSEVYDYLFAALADTFGGYLQTYGLPLLHEAYYEGYVSFDNAAEFHRLHDNFKDILMTNGEGWTKPMEVRKHINRILPLKLPITIGSSKPCALLLADANGHRELGDDYSVNDNSSTTLIPLPILDDTKKPSSIAIPFKNHALYNLKSRNSYDILIKYYIETSRCISQLQRTGLEQSQFDRVFSNWLKTKVLSRLKDDAWYVGFSNVLRIEETIQQRGGMIAANPRIEKEEESLFSELESETQLTRTAYIAILIILLLSLLFICFLYWTFLKNCIFCCGQVDVDSSRRSCPSDMGDTYPTDRTSLLSASDESSNMSARGKDRRKACKHGKKTDSSNCDPHSKRYSPRTVSEESRLTISCGQGKGFPSCRKHHN